MSQEPERIRNYINGEWVVSRARTRTPVTNPATGETIAYVPSSTRKEVDAAVEAAREAFPGWRATPLSKRIEHLSLIRDFIRVRKDALARSITREHGKVYADARGEMVRVLENMTQALNIGLMQGDYLPNIATGGINVHSRRMPLGVFCGIMPFNFPAMIKSWSFPYALLTGNTFIVKPSEQTPLTSALIFEIIREYGKLPPGVINLVHGGKAVTNRLITHPDVVGVSSVTSTPIMKAIWKKATAHGKRAQCQGGAKNFVVVMDDVDIETVVPHIIDSVFGNSGQRCLAGSNVVLVGDQKFHLKLLDRLVEGARQIRVGAGNRPNVDMGPVVSQEARERIISYIERGLAAGACLLVDGRDVEPDGEPGGFWVGPTIFSNVTPDMDVACAEIFGPVMTVMNVRNIDEALHVIAASPYGNAAMVFTESGAIADRFEEDDVLVGNLGINIGLPAPVPPFPFGGMKDSFLGTLHGQGTDSIDFFTDKKVIIKRWFRGSGRRKY